MDETKARIEIEVIIYATSPRFERKETSCPLGEHMDGKKRIALIVVIVLVVVGIAISFFVSQYETEEEREQINQEALDSETTIMLLE